MSRETARIDAIQATIHDITTIPEGRNKFAPWDNRGRWFGRGPAPTPPPDVRLVVELDLAVHYYPNGHRGWSGPVAVETPFGRAVVRAESLDGVTRFDVARDRSDNFCEYERLAQRHGIPVLRCAYPRDGARLVSPPEPPRPPADPPGMLRGRGRRSDLRIFTL